MKEMNIFERVVGGKRYRIASQSVWDPGRQRPFARQAVLGPADPPPLADLGLVRTIGTRRVGDVGALVWVAEQLDLIGLIDQACGQRGPEDGPTIGEMVVAVAVQRPVRPGPSAIWRPFWNRVYPGFHACRQRRSQDRRFIDWRRVSPMSNWKRRNSGSRGRRWSASVCRRMCWRSTQPTSTRISQLPPLETWRVGGTPRASEATCA